MSIIKQLLSDEETVSRLDQRHMLALVFDTALEMLDDEQTAEIVALVHSESDRLYEAREVLNAENRARRESGDRSAAA